MNDTARRKLDIIYEDVLGDVGEILNRVDSLKADLPRTADQMVDKLKLQTGHYLAAAEKLGGVLVGMKQEVDRAAAQAAATAGEAAKLDVRRAVTQAAGDAIGNTVGNEVGKVVNRIDNAADHLMMRAQQTKEEIEAAGRAVSWGVWRLLGWVVFGSLISSSVMLLGIRYLPKKDPVEQLSLPDHQALMNGRALNRIWDKLTPQEKARYEALAKEQ